MRFNSVSERLLPILKKEKNMVYLGTVAEWIIEFLILGTALLIWAVAAFIIAMLINLAIDFINNVMKEV